MIRQFTLLNFKKIKNNGFSSPIYIAKLTLFAFCFQIFSINAGPLEEGEKLFKQKNYKSAFEILKPLADSGSSVAQGYVAQIYAIGKEVPKDMLLSNRYANMSAEQGDPRGLFNLGTSYLYGQGVDKNFDKAISLLRQADSKGIPEAAYLLGNIYDTGNGVPKNLLMAKEYYEKSAQNGNSNAQNNLGSMYIYGRGTDKDSGKAREWFEKSVAQGHVLAETNLGYMLVHGVGGNKDTERGIQLLEKAIGQKQSSAMVYLGRLYLYGTGAPKDLLKAKHLFEQSATMGNVNGQLNLAQMYEAGLGVPQDYSQATKWYRSAADQGNSVAQTSLGILYLNGLGVPQDKNQAIEFFKMAASQGNTIAVNNLESIKAEAKLKNEHEIKFAKEAERIKRLPYPDIKIIEKCAGHLYGYTKISSPIGETRKILVEEANNFLDLLGGLEKRRPAAVKAVNIGEQISVTYFSLASQNRGAEVGILVRQIKNIINLECAEYGANYGIKTYLLPN
jgi:TPR repeat protein